MNVCTHPVVVLRQLLHLVGGVKGGQLHALALGKADVAGPAAAAHVNVNVNVNINAVHASERMGLTHTEPDMCRGYTADRRCAGNTPALLQRHWRHNG
jgi:hypothetical protein